MKAININYAKAEKFLEDKFGYTKQEITEFNKHDNLQILRLYNTISGINHNIKSNCKRDNCDSFTN